MTAVAVDTHTEGVRQSCTPSHEPLPQTPRNLGPQALSSVNLLVQSFRKSSAADHLSSPRLYSLRPEGGAADATLAGGHTVTIRADTRTPHCEGVAPAAKDEGESAGTSAAFKTSSYLLAPSVLRWV